MTRYGPKSQQKVKETVHEAKLLNGRSDKKVTSLKQFVVHARRETVKIALRR